MKKIITIILLFAFSATFGQTFPNTHPQSSNKTIEVFRGAIEPILGLINGRYVDTASANLSYIKSYAGAQIVVGNNLYIRNTTATKWEIISGGGGGGGLVNGSAITSLPTIGYVPNETDPASWINNVFYQSQNPTATLTGGQILEYRSAQAMAYTLNWSAGRLMATEPIQSIIINGASKPFSQPPAGNTVSGTHNVSFPANTDITYTNTVTTTDSKTATASTTFSFQPKRYFGWISTSDTAGIGLSGYNDAKITALGNELSTGKSKSFSTGNPTGEQIYVYAYYTPFGDLTQWDMNGFPSLAAMNKATRSFTNALGFVGTWTIYWSKNGQTLSSTIVAN